MNIRTLMGETWLDTVVRWALALALAGGVFLLVWLFRRSPIIITNNPALLASEAAPLTGLPCKNAPRPIAVMLASDPEARPLSGIGAADVVFEMPVTPNGITRMMAVYQCQPEPKEIGSIRSARADFIPLAQGLHTLYAHWGGEQGALEQLDKGIIDNINALIYEGSTFYRKNNIARPHNGFTTLQLLRDRADTLGYAASASIPVFPHVAAPTERTLTAAESLVTIPWPQGMGVEFRYDQASDTYLRSRGGTPELDKLTGKQVAVSTVIVATTDATFLRDQYITVRTTGHGVATIYQRGQRLSAQWQKPTAKDPLVFTDSRGNALSLAPGPLWIIFDAPLPQP